MSHGGYPVKINVKLPTISKLGLLKQQPSQPPVSARDLTLPPIQHPQQWDWLCPGRTQSDGSPTRHPARPTRVRSTAPRYRTRPELLTPIDLIVRDGKCNYVSLQGEVCGETSSCQRNGDIAKHWLTRHAMWEMRRIEEGQIALSQANIINTEARMHVANRFRSRCPNPCCRNPTCYYVRPEALTEHLTTCSAGPYLPPRSREAAKQLARELLAEIVQYDRELFRNGYEAAVWRILHAR
ncbi:hypothetical protein JB92DRAFT_2837055 [Gautieria morchelliformis]|nr:hypothetical protein JB92DRAFT_2837055 [Gautieria morchelliformis]